MALAGLIALSVSCVDPDETVPPTDAGKNENQNQYTDGGTPPPSPDAGIHTQKDAGHAPQLDGGTTNQPVDCSSISANHTLCETTDEECRFVFEDGSGCAVICEQVGLVCREVYEDLAGECAPDTSRPALTCDPPSGHSSDYCVCRRDEPCEPDCANRECGNDGCGGNCGICESGFGCVDGQCVSQDLTCESIPYGPNELLSELVGYGRHTTGGDPNNVYHVTTTAGSGSGSLKTALESEQDYWIVFDIGVDAPASIDLGEEATRIKSNKTVDGRGRDVTVDGALEFRDGVRNVIMTDLRLTNSHGERCGQSADVISITGDGADTPGTFENRDLWFHHLDMYDGGDGLIDIRGGSRITISWSHFHDHAKAMLFSMEETSELEGREMEVTLHHNFFDRVSRRCPQLTRGRVHSFNNYQYDWWEFAAASVIEAELLSEANIYEARPGLTCGSLLFPCQDPNPCGGTDYLVSKVAISNDWAVDDRGYVRTTGDLLINDATIAVHESDQVSDPDYSYAPEIASNELAQQIRAAAGPRTTFCQ
jgi:pectate lyase